MYRIQSLFLVGAVLGLLGCGQNDTTTKATTAEDLGIAHQAISLDEVSLMLRSGISQSSITAEIRNRHIPEKPTPALELKLADSGASAELINELKDDKNILTSNQKIAYAEWIEGRDRGRHQGVQGAQNAAPNQAYAEQQEHQRLVSLQQESFRNIEQRRREQQRAEQQQASSHSRYQNTNGNAGLYSTPSRRLSPRSPYGQ